MFFEIVLSFVKPHLGKILEANVKLLNEIELDQMVDVFSQLIDRLDSDIVPYAIDLVTALLVMFEGVQEDLIIYMKKFPHEFEQLGYHNNDDSKQEQQDINTNKTHVDTRSDEQQKQDFEKFGDKISCAMQCIKTLQIVAFSASGLPQVLSKIDEKLRPLINAFFQEYFYYQNYSDEMLGLILTLIDYSDPPSQLVWKLCSQVAKGYVHYYSDKFNQTAQVLAGFIRASKKYNISLDNFMGYNIIGDIFEMLDIAMNDDYVDPLFLAVMYDSLCSTYKGKEIVNLDAYLFGHDSESDRCVVDKCVNVLKQGNPGSDDMTQNMRGAMVHILSVIIFYDPLYFLQFCCSSGSKSKNTDKNDSKNKNKNKNGKYFYEIMNLIKDNWNDSTWPAQRACAIGLSSLFTVDASMLPNEFTTSKYLQQLRNLLDLVTQIILAINYTEGDDFSDKENENGYDDNSNDNISDNDDNNSGENLNDDLHSPAAEARFDSQSSVNGCGDGDKKLLSLDANEDFVNEADQKYLSMSNRFENGEIDLQFIMSQWDDTSTTVPSTPLDYINDAVYFMQCATKLNNGPNSFKQVVQDWDQNIAAKDKKLLDKYVEQGKQALEDQARRFKQFEQDALRRKEVSTKLMQNELKSQ